MTRFASHSFAAAAALFITLLTFQQAVVVPAAAQPVSTLLA